MCIACTPSSWPDSHLTMLISLLSSGHATLAASCRLPQPSIQCLQCLQCLQYHLQVGPFSPFPHNVCHTQSTPDVVPVTTACTCRVSSVDLRDEGFTVVALDTGWVRTETGRTTEHHTNGRAPLDVLTSVAGKVFSNISTQKREFPGHASPVGSSWALKAF